MSTGFANYKTASEIRDVIKTIVNSEVNKRFPPERFAKVDAIDREHGVVDVTLAGTNDELKVPASPSMQPREVGDIVKIAGRNGSYRIVDILNRGAYNVSVDPVLDQANADLDELNTVTLPQLQIDLAENDAELANLNDVVLPQLQIDLDAAEVDLANLNDVVLPQLQLDLDAANAEIDQRSRVLTQSSRPTGLTSTDRIYWMNTADDYKTEFWNGTAWTVVTYGTSSIAAGSVITSHMTAGTIDADRMVIGSITTDRMTANSIQGDRIAANTMHAGRITSGTITTDRMTANTINGDRISGLTLHGDKITGNTIHGDKITGNTVNGDRIIGNTLHGDKIIGNTIIGDKIAGNTITSDHVITAGLDAGVIKFGTMSGDRIQTGSLQVGQVNGLDYRLDIAEAAQYVDDFSDMSRWNYSIGGSLQYRNDIQDFGDKSLQSNSTYYAMYGNARIPFDPGTLYKVTVRLRSGGGNPRFYLGVRTYKADKTIAGTGNGNWYGIANRYLPGSGVWYEYTTYFQGTSGSGGTLESPGSLTSDTKYFGPLVLFNYQATAGDIMQMSMYKVEAVGQITDIENLWGYPSDVTYIDGGNIYTNTINTDQLNANAITSKHTITGALLQTDSTGDRWEIGTGTDKIRIKGYTPAGTTVIKTSYNDDGGGVSNSGSFQIHGPDGGAGMARPNMSIYNWYGIAGWQGYRKGIQFNSEWVSFKPQTSGNGYGHGVYFYGLETTGAGANAFINSSGMLSKSTSSARYKHDIEDFTLDPKILLSLRSRRFHRVEDYGLIDRPWSVGFISEEAEELGLTQWVEYDKYGQPDGFDYPGWTAALQAIARYHEQVITDQADKIEALTNRVATLEGISPL